MTVTPPTTNPTSEASASATRHLARERVRAMESLAGAIAHEIRPAVLAVTSAAQLLRYSLPPNPVAEKSIGRILQESERLSALHEALSEYATEAPARLVAGDPDRVWSKVMGDLRGTLEANSVLLTHSGASGVVCAIDAGQLTRAFERIVHHALGRVQAGAELDVVSSAEDERTWISTISIAPESLHLARPDMDSDRPAFLLALANRTLVAHDGGLTEHHGDDGALLVSVRLPRLPAE
jgi:signal transduction histidine kinase